MLSKHSLRHPNHVPNPAEATYLRTLLEEDLKERRLLSSRIEVRQAAINETKAVINDIEKSIRIAESIYEIVNRRLQSSTTTETSASLVEGLFKITNNDTKTRKSRENLCQIFEQHQIALARLRIGIQDDVQELERAGATVRSLKDELSEAQYKLELEQETMATLVQCFSKISSSLKVKRQMLSASRRVPEEVLAEVFRILILGDIFNARNVPYKHRKATILVICSVCSRWRKIGMKTPSLWQYIPLIKPQDQVKYAEMVAMFHQYTERSNPSGELVIHWPSASPWEVTEQAAPTKRYLYSAPSIKRITDPLAFYTERQNVPLFFRKARSVEMIGNSDRVDKVAIAPLSTTTSYTFRNLFPEFNGSFIHVTQLFLFLPTLQTVELQRILRALPSLMSLDLNIEYGSLAGVEDDVVDLRALTRLSANTVILNHLFRSLIRTPRLEGIALKGAAVGVSPSTVMRDTVLVEGRLPYLQRLSISGSVSTEYTQVQIIPVLEGLRKVETLELEGSHLTPVITTIGSLSSLLPALRDLILRDCDIPGSTIKQLLRVRKEAIEGNPSRPSQVKRLVLDHCAALDKQFCDGMKDMVDELVIYF